MKNKIMLFLTLETFSNTGGVQNVSRYLSKALAELTVEMAENVQILSLCDRSSDVDSRYVNSNSFKGFGYNKLSFCIAAFLRGRLADTIILSHINLLSIARCIKYFLPETRIILVAHGKEVWSGLSEWKKRLLRKNVEIWAVSTFTKQALIRNHQIPNEKVTVLNNCLDPYFTVPAKLGKPMYLLERYNLRKDDLVMFSISRLTKYEKDKGYDMILDLMPELVIVHPMLRYIIAGHAEENERCRINNRITSLNLAENVLLVGFVPDAELCDHHLLSDLFIMPSHKEGFGLVFLEALVCGSRVIAGNKDGSVDALLNGQLGTLVNPKSKTEVFNAITAQLKQPPNLKESYKRQQLTIRAFQYEGYKRRIAELLNTKQLNK